MHNNYKQNQGFLPKHVFSRTGSIWKMGRSSGRQNSSRGDARLFYLYDFSEKIGFPARGRFMIFRTVSEMFDENNIFSKNVPEVSGSARGASPTYPGPYLTNFDENRLKHNYYKNSL